MARAPAALVVSLIVLCACGEETPPIGDTPGVVDREPGDRSPLTAVCDDADTLRCLLPWPSSTFTRADESSPTGLRLAIDADGLEMHEDTSILNLATGFSQVTPIMTGFPMHITPPPAMPGTAGPLRLLLAEHDHPNFGSAVPLRIRHVVEGDEDNEGDETLLIAYPLRPLEANADYVAVVLDELLDASGEPLIADRHAELSLALAEPETDEERALVGYHAPTRTTLEAAGIDRERVVRVWDFTTRPADEPGAWLRVLRAATRAAVADGSATVVVDDVDTTTGGAVAMIVRGHLAGLPDFRDAEGALVFDEAGDPVPVGETAAPFRVLVPAGIGDYRFVMFGHGTGGQFDDPAFDGEIAEAGVAKVGFDIHGWTGSDVILMLVELGEAISGSHESATGLMQAIAEGSAIQLAMEGLIGDVLAAPTIGGEPNPAAGRRPWPDTTIWAGGSLGGTVGFVYASIEPSIDYAVLNVPGAAWTHWMPDADLYDTLSALMEPAYGGAINLLQITAMVQGNWDPVDGAVYGAARAQHPIIALVQESIGDPILPNAGSEMIAVCLDAAHVGRPIEPILDLPFLPEVSGASAITQYRVDSDYKFDIHGFGDTDQPAGIAAREQIAAFLQSAWDGAPRITVPTGCADPPPADSCDFRSE